MNTKLTLSLNREVIRKAKRLSRKRKTSISKMVEEYLMKVSEQDDRSGAKKKSVADELCGILKSVPKDFDWKKERMKLLEEKYGK